MVREDSPGVIRPDTRLVKRSLFQSGCGRSRKPIQSLLAGGRIHELRARQSAIKGDIEAADRACGA